MIRVGIIGLGHWGPNLVRCFNEIQDCKVTVVCDRDLARLTKIKDRYPNILAKENSDDVFDPKLIDAVVIATPTQSHHALASRALDGGFHTFVEKPLAKTSAECHDLIRRAGESGAMLFVGHVFLHSAPMEKLRALVDTGELGEVCYVACKRLNLGPVRQDVSALFDLAPHDISMLLSLLGGKPESVNCVGLAHLNTELHDVCNLTMRFPNNRLGIVHVSWLDPMKQRVLTVVGSKKMAVYDDLGLEKIKVYDKGVVPPKDTGNFADFQFSYRHGGSYSPWLNETEPLKAECTEFIRCIVEGDIPVTDGHNGLAVVEVLEAADQSLREGGAPIPIVELSEGATVHV